MRPRSFLTVVTLLLIVAATGSAHAQPDTGDAGNVASPVDDSFLNALRAAGITYSQPDQAVKAGRTLCDLADNGKTDDEIVSILKKHNEYLSNGHANGFMELAYRSYCPQYVTARG